MQRAIAYAVLAGGLLIMLNSASITSAGEERTENALPRVNDHSRAGTAEERLSAPVENARIVIYKSKRRLELYSDQKLIRTYRVGLGFSPVADKRIEGDGATPEGDFYVFVKNIKSAYYLSLGISYPNAEDASRGLKDNLISKSEHDAIISALEKNQMPPQNTKLGGLIYIHGNGSSRDWTWGCVALDNADMKELYDAVEVRTPVTINH
jgi:murein L,D-transpeptidase YafK